MARQKKGFTIPLSYIDPIDRMTDAEAGRVIKAALRYANGIPVSNLGEPEMTAFSFFRGSIRAELGLDAVVKKNESTEDGRQSGECRGDSGEKENERPTPPPSPSPDVPEPDHVDGQPLPETPSPAVSESEESGEPDADAEAEEKPPKKKRGRKPKGEVTPKPEKEKPPKVQYAEFVSMTEAEHEKLVDKYGEDAAARMIEILDNYKGSNGKRYTNDYRAILSWVVEKYENEASRPAVNRQQNSVPAYPQSGQSGKTEEDDWLSFYEQGYGS